MNGTVFSEIALSQVPRILGFLNQEPASAAYGCCDRPYWHYKVVDFANVRFQEASLVLSLAYLSDIPGNRFYQSARIKEWTKAAINFWMKNRHRDGSTDESYPLERHFCSTAFSLHAVTESLLLLGEQQDQDFKRSGDFLMRRNNKDTANQIACASEALYNLYLLTKDQ